MSSLLYILSSLTHYQKESDKNSRNKTVWVCHPYPSIKKVFEGLELAKKWQYVDFRSMVGYVAMCVGIGVGLAGLAPVGVTWYRFAWLCQLHDVRAGIIANVCDYYKPIR